MFGNTGSRDFYFPVSIGDSISLKWEAEINGSFPNSSVTTFDNYVFINDLSGRVYCFDASNGKVIGALKHNGSVFTTPVIDQNNIIFAAAEDDESKSLLYYYNFSTAKMLYENEIPGRVMTEMIKTDKEIFFNTEDGKVFCFNLVGEKVWEYDTKSKIHSSPALGNNIIVFGNDDGEIIGINAKEGKLLFNEKIGESFFCGAAVDGNNVYIGNDNGNLYALELSSGKVNWKFETGARITMVPVYNKTHIIIGNLKGELYSVNKETGKLNWRTNTRGVLNASPLLTENFIILPDLNEAYHFVDVKTGEVKKTYLLDGRGKLTPVIFNEVLYIGYDNGILRAYEFNN
ncbi:MAG: hypothetical protein A2V93_02545 [Ignavibacteria bacterium RBG_16_34_14]|nr:MAG: hypothetical protein A2V93_02545 [Ignavibacteria bacterium RBG_16_34_14]